MGKREVKRCFRKVYDVLWYYSNVIVFAVLLAGAAAFIISKFLMIPTYESTAKIAVWVNEGEEESLSEEEMRLNAQLSGDCAELISSRNVVEQVIASFQLRISYEEFLKNLEVASSEQNHIVKVTVKDADPELAKQILDEICLITGAEMKEMVSMDAMHVIDEGLVAEKPVAPDAVLWTVLGALFGGFAAIVFVLVRDLLDETIRSAEDIEKYLQLDTLTIIPFSDAQSGENGDEEEV